MYYQDKNILIKCVNGVESLWIVGDEIHLHPHMELHMDMSEWCTNVCCKYP